MIEHVPFLQVLGFFKEWLRVLEPGGLLGIAFPDVGRFLTSRSMEFTFNPAALGYADGLALRPGLEVSAPAPDRTRVALWHMLTGWGHQTAGTEHSGARALLVVGFSRVCRGPYGHGRPSAARSASATTR